MTNFIVPDWSAPDHIKAVTTVRNGGVSEAPYESFNLAHHVNDKPEHVDSNRDLLRQRLSLPAQPVWLKQVHETRILSIDNTHDREPQADGSYSRSSGQVCAVMTADCLPLLMCNRAGSEVAAVHAGWRGLLAGVIEAALDCFQSPADEMMVWLGPAIGPQAFEVGAEVRELFLRKSGAADTAFISQDNNKYLANIYELARLRLQSYGVQHISGGQHCTVTETSLFYSYRREPVTGRMASLIWIE